MYKKAYIKKSLRILKKSLTTNIFRYFEILLQILISAIVKLF